jgi:exopolyphosphatase/guanosine-5'-triphosphate,3'-diphosphate pyrophosphatase
VSTVAAVDCGTNTIKLLIGRRASDDFEVVARKTRVVRLGQGVDATGRLADEALERAFGAIDEYAALIRDAGVHRIRFCATSATRDAANADVFRAGVLARLGVEPEVLSGEEEAALAFSAAMGNLPDGVAMPVLVVDIGGGSTELVLGDTDGVRASRSMDIGSVRLHERHVRTDPPSEREIAAVVADIDAHLDAQPVPVEQAASVVGVAGTITTVAAMVLDLPAYDVAAIDRSVHDVAAVLQTVDRLVAMTVAERRALPYMHPGRADVIDAGVLIAARVLGRATVDTLVVGEADILEGIAWSMG